MSSKTKDITGSDATDCSPSSLTPETDANTYRASTLASADLIIPVVHADFARRLERERDESRKRMEEIIKGLHEIKHYAHMNGGSLIGLKIFHLIYPENK